MNLRRRRRPTPVIPIVAMVDILVITLLFIVATTTFRKRRTEVPVNLPTASHLGKAVPAEELSTALTATKDKKYMLDGKEVEPADLVTALKELKAKSPNVKLKLAVDADAPHGMFTSALNALVVAGYTKDVNELIQRSVEGANPK